MKRIAAIAAMSAALISGCASVRISEQGDRTMVDITNTGWYLLNLIPLASGDPYEPNGCSCMMFRRTVTLENNVKLLEYAVKKTGAKSIDSVVSYTTDESVLFFLFKRHVCHTSAELIVPKKDDKENEDQRVCNAP